MLEHSSWYEYYRLGSNSNNGEQSISFSPNANFKLGVYFGWRWIFLGYSFDVKDIFGGHKNKAKKTEMALNLYSSKFGVDLYWRKTGSDFKIRSYNGFQLNTPTKNMDFNGFQRLLDIQLQTIFLPCRLQPIYKPKEKCRFFNGRILLLTA